jgi:hypothetical protein
VHGISSGSLRIPPAPAPPTSLPPPHVYGGIMDDMNLNDPNDDLDDDDDDENMMEGDECQIHLKDDMIVMDADINNEPFINMNNASMNIMNNNNNANNNSTNVNHYMNISSTINPNVNTSVNDYYQNVIQLQNGESV